MRINGKELTTQNLEDLRDYVNGRIDRGQCQARLTGFPGSDFRPQTLLSIEDASQLCRAFGELKNGGK